MVTLKRIAGLLTAALAAALAALALISCSPAANESDNVSAEVGAESALAATATTDQYAEMNVVGLKGPTGIGMVKMMDDAASQPETPFHFSLVSAPDEAVSSIINGEADIALVPTNLAATLYGKMNGGVEMVAITSLGNLFILEQGDTIHSMADLKGQTIYATGKGANPQYILEHLLTQAGLTPGQDVTIEYLSEHAELATLVASGERTLAMLPEPFVATAMAKNSDLRVALDLNEVWESQNSGAMAMGCAIVRTDYLDAHPESVICFRDALHESIDFCSSNVDETAALCVTYGIIGDEAVAREAIPRCAITYIAGDEMKPEITDFFTVLYNANPASVGGAIPADGFYYTG